MKRPFRSTALILSLVYILGIFSACGITEPEETTALTTAPPTVITTMTTSVYTATTTSVESSTLPPAQKTYTQEEVDAMVEERIKKEISDAIAVNYVLPPEGYPDNYPMPYASGVYAKEDNITANAYCIFGENDSEIFVIYRYAGYGPYFPTEICYHESVGGVEPWDRIAYTCGEVSVDIFAIDRKHFIVLWDMFKNGYVLTVFEDGISPSQKGGYAPYYNLNTNIDLSYLFPEEEFEGAGEGLLDDGYVFFQSVTDFYFEKIDDGSCRIVLEYEKDGVQNRRTAIYDINGIRPE